MIQKVPCIQCGVMILPTTVAKTGGFCMPCYGREEERYQKIDKVLSLSVPVKNAAAELFVNLTSDENHPYEKLMQRDRRSTEVTWLSSNGLPPKVYTHFDSTASAGFVAALWLFDHAGVFLRAIRDEHKDSKVSNTDDPIELSQRIISALTNEIGLPNDEKVKLLSLLFLEIGISLQTDVDSWEDDSKQKLLSFAKRASLKSSFNGCESLVLPWVLQIEQMEQVLPLPERVASLKELIAQQRSQKNITELELNNWAYFLLLIGKWKAATAMATIATEMARTARNLDTLGWAYFFEGEIDHSIRLLLEAVKKPEDDFHLDSAFLIRDKEYIRQERFLLHLYHLLYVLLHAGQTSNAFEVHKIMMRISTNSFWTNKAKNLEILFNDTVDQVDKSSQRSAKVFQYDIALSFAGEDRPLAEALASELKKFGIKVFYDEFEKAEFWGKNMYSYLTDIYQHKAKYCIMFISKNYTSKRWTNLEREAAQARAFLEDREYQCCPKYQDSRRNNREKSGIFLNNLRFS